MKKLKGFTLIELLIVVAIIAILAAIAVPNFLEAQVRSKVSRVRSDHRSLATGVEAYYVDNNTYPAMAGVTNQVDPNPDYTLITTSPRSAGRTFRVRNNTRLSTLTTPVAFITSYFTDPFADTRGLTFRYYNANNRGWILGSFGPDTDQAAGGDLFWNEGDLVINTNLIETVYNPLVSQPSILLITGAPAVTNGRGAYTYDPTNGTVSQGDVWRVRQ